MVLFHQAIRIARANRAQRTFPDFRNSRTVDGLLFPVFKPKFPLRFAGSTVFGIGSCFARNIEQVLASYGVTLPTSDFTAPRSEYPHRSNGLLNEYSPATINQRIMFALGGKAYPEETIVPVGDMWVDLLLPSTSGVTFERALERRREIASVYERLMSADLVIVTLGLVETWYDTETKMYLNQMPPPPLAAKNPRRFEFRRLNTGDCIRMLDEALSALAAAGAKILLSVSPVALITTFTPRDCVAANEFSKAVLRVTAERLTINPSIDYFPSYEIVRSGGLSSYMPDQIHVRPEIVDRVMAHMLACYANTEDEPATAKEEPAEAVAE